MCGAVPITLNPFPSHAQTQHVADLIHLPHDVVESKLSQMILDKKLNGILDQAFGCLIIYDASFAVR